jgi:hypothetical protein
MPEYIDDASISYNELLYRRVKLKVDLITFDPGSSKLRPTSTAFKNTVKVLDVPPDAASGTEPECIETYMSIFIHTCLIELGLNSGNALDGVEDFVLVKLIAGEVRDCGVAKGVAQAVFRAPEPPPPACMEAHGGVSGKKTKAIRNNFSDRAVWIIRPSIDWVLENRSTLRIPDDFPVEANFETLFS